MSDEFVQDQPVADAPVQDVIVEGKPVETQEKQPEVPPYHSQETWAIAKEAHEEGAKPADPKDFEYEFNGYTVKAVEAADGTRGDENGLVYEITQGDFKKTLIQKQDAINFAQTHSSDFAKNA